MNLTEEKQKNLITFFLKKNGGQIERLELMKLIWMSDRLHLNKYGRTISKANYFALPYGPVPSRIFDLSKHSSDSFKINNFNVLALTEFNSDFFSKSDLEIMEYTWLKFNKMGSIRFSDYSHKFPEWLRFKTQLENGSYSKSYPINMQDFFEFPDLEEFIDVLTVEEIKHSQIQYNEHSSFQEFLNN
ncbi:Panacea domain-containing protein [Chryseobacterium ureilyticum]|nr:Panacea domain-containing protein [Chryseobacterium ureilyticum]